MEQTPQRPIGMVQWCCVCVIALLVSIFLHEVGHGLANALRGIPCSTGFNRVGDLYKVPSDPGFREEYATAPAGLLDFGVPVTLTLAAAASVLFYKAKNRRLAQAVLPFAVSNSMLRLVPCLWVVLAPMLTGTIHLEDEYQTGVVIAEKTGWAWLTYLPALFSILISAGCIFLITMKIKKSLPARTFCAYALLSLLSFQIAMFLASYLDNVCRINWKALP